MKRKPTIEDFLNLPVAINCDSTPEDFFDSRGLNKYFGTQTDIDLNLFDGKQLESELDIDKGRWYETSTAIFELDGRYLGVTGVSTSYNEMNSISDAGIDFEFNEYEEIKIISYKIKSS